MGLLEIVVLALVVAVGAILVLASRKPDQFRIERRAIVPASPETVFAEINDLVRWQAWSPWAKKDPNAKATFGALTAGQGAEFAWDGNGKVGKGRMTITEARPAQHIALRLEFEKPFKATNMAEFSLAPRPGGTEVVWTMTGHANLMSKVMDVLMNMDKMVGTDFEKGLANLREVVARQA